MKILHLIGFSILLSVSLHAQWTSIPRIGNYEIIPRNQFIINPYTNQLWLVNDRHAWSDFGAAVIESNGEVNFYGEAILGTLPQFGELCFAFTPDNVYYSRKAVGLKRFDVTSTQMIYSTTGIENLFFDYDTLFFCGSSFANLYTYNPSNGVENSFKSCTGKLKSKNGHLYLGKDILYKWENGNPVYLFSDSHYLQAYVNDYNFRRADETLYVGSKKGISVAYEYDFFDTITPYNTTNMPSPNVLEIEFDLDDNIWAVFGNEVDMPFALAKLEGSEWVNVFDAENSPIDFSYQGTVPQSRFMGLEIDTLGNVWVADLNSLHILNGPNNPGWLSTFTLNAQLSVEMYPNPSSGFLHFVAPENTQFDKVEFRDLSGKMVLSAPYTEQLQHQLSNGCYLVEFVQSGKVITRKKLVVSR